MKKAKAKIPAKLNLTLDVAHAENGYHQLNSIVCSISLYDELTVKPRKDYAITLTEKGLKSGCAIEKNNAYKTAEKLSVLYGAFGADITINKHIFVGGGLGGSSADIAGVIKCNQQIYGISDTDALDLANSLGSDSGYMLKGGFSLLEGRGDKISKIGKLPKTYMLLIENKKEVLAKDVFKTFDKMGKEYPPCSKKLIDVFMSGNILEFFKNLKNDLTDSAIEYCPEIKTAINSLLKVGAINALMTGSGPTVFGIFESKKARDIAYKKLKSEYKERIVKVHTL
ncbi:MAG: 4-(cytidine 5'-diphospho)-2-C-methyl-D-erythritol kinase [Clostridia bacterium]|nr:4-(cytidine 5'-diphospho)-2-C-methyl-D-erythritol kinase [Clostridia bacterium]